jgi:general secretion pathway protein D
MLPPSACHLIDIAAAAQPRGWTAAGRCMTRSLLIGMFAALLPVLPGSAVAQVLGGAPGWFQVHSPPVPAQPLTTTATPQITPPAIPPASEGLIAEEGDSFEVVPLKYADVSEIVGLLTGNSSVKPNDNFLPEAPNFGSSGSQGYFGGNIELPNSSPIGIVSDSLSDNGPIGQVFDATIGVDRRLNAVVLRGPPERLAQIKSEIAQLDVPVTSVVLETEFVELSQTGARNLGLDFTNGNDQLGSLSVTYARGFPGVEDTPHIGGFAANFQVALYAQIAKGQGRIVSKPRISAQSGTTAKIITGDALPILTSIAISGVNAVQQQVQYVNVGVTLQIAPRVSSDGNVTAHVFAVVSSVSGYSQGYPTISQREASTSATVRDGETFIIGGLTQESNISNKSKLPLLGDIPLVGSLFSVEHTNKINDDLYIVVTPHIVRPLKPAA